METIEKMGQLWSRDGWLYREILYFNFTEISSTASLEHKKIQNNHHWTHKPDANAFYYARISSAKNNRKKYSNKLPANLQTAYYVLV